MSKYEHGRVLSVDEVKSGSELVADHAAGVSSLTVVDAADFDEDGGWLSVNDQVIEYTAADDDTGTLTLNGTLTALADEGDRVYVWNPKRAAISSELIAEVMVDGEGDNVDPVEATVALHLIPQLPEGIRGSDGESVLLELDGDEWRVVDVLGVAQDADLKFEADDFYTLTAADITAGTATFSLSHRPIDESVKAVLASVPQRPTEYTVNYDAQTITWPLDGFEKAGDVIWVHYAYRKGIATPRVPVPVTNPSVYVGVESMAWPSGSAVGDLVVIASMQGPNDGFSALNGWSNLGASAPVTHASNVGPLTYRLVVLAKVRQAGDVFPTRSDGFYESVFMVASMTGPTGVTDVAFDMVPDAASASTPALKNARLRVWGTVSDDTNIVPARGDVLGNVGPLPDQDIDICVTADTTEAAVSATVQGTAPTAGWCVATIAVGG